MSTEQQETFYRLAITLVADKLAKGFPISAGSPEAKQLAAAAHAAAESVEQSLVEHANRVD